MMKQRHKIERESNIGEEVGWTKSQEVAKKNPKLLVMNKKFGMIHGLSSLTTIMSFGSLAILSWYLAGEGQLPDHLRAQCQLSQCSHHLQLLYKLVRKDPMYNCKLYSFAHMGAPDAQQRT